MWWNGHTLNLLVVAESRVATVGKAVAAAMPGHYASSARIADILERLGKQKAATYLREKLPRSSRIRSGDLAEILATEYVDARTPFRAPIRRLRWKYHREMSMRGDDLIAIAVPSEGEPIGFLKAEVKSRASLNTQAVAAARESLNGDNGLPSPHALAFVADRLAETGNEELSDLITVAQLNDDISNEQVQHLLFTLSGNAPGAFLKTDLEGYGGDIRQNAVGLRVANHRDFVAAVYDAVAAEHEI